jgi:hypothetical protein
MTTTQRRTGVSTQESAAWPRRQWLAALGAVLLPAAWANPAAAPLVEVWKSPTCGCCVDWIKYLQAKGFQVKVNDVGFTPAVRAKLGIDDRYGSCHTALVGGYAIEGHVPVREIRRLLHERPKAIGLAVPGMPIGSPGMDGPEYNGRLDAYDVLLLDKNGTASVYAHYKRG